MRLLAFRKRLVRNIKLRRKSVTVNGVNSNEKAEERIVARMCFVVYN